MPSFKVDTERIADSAARLSSVVDSLGTDSLGTIDGSTFGRDPAVSVMSDFVKVWTAGRRTLSTELSKIKDAMTTAVANYSSAEEASRMDEMARVQEPR